VLCEKPFTVNADQLRKLIALAQSKQLFMMEALWSKFLPGIIKTKDLIDAGVIGDAIVLQADFGLHFPYDAEHRLFNPLLAGGALLDLGIYPLYLSLYLFGKPSMMKAHAVLNENKIDLTTSIITQSKSGTVSSLYTTTQANTPVKAIITGTKGAIELDAWWFTPADVTLRVDGKEEEILPFPAIVNGYEYEIMEAIRCLREGKTESDIMPFSFSLLLMEQMDEIRRLTGISYPEAIEKPDPPFGWDEL
jgi:predicted dehydrogenase